MVKMIALGIIVTVATLAGAYAGLVTSQPKAPTNTNEQEPVEFVKLDATSVPIIRDGGIMGYVVVRSAFSASAKDVKQNRTSMTVFVAEALFKSIYAEQGLNFAAMKPLQLDALTEGTTKAANARIGRDAIKQLAIESLSFLTVEEVRSQQK
jgi:hypothetical protein